MKIQSPKQYSNGVNNEAHLIGSFFPFGPVQASLSSVHASYTRFKSSLRRSCLQKQGGMSSCMYV